ncbi:unnamed protein product [Staurois parvus]|uniref:Secreted protein n=1 Tax=Staurois parvus TaxID=386267 RepID=A0ABN9DW78_9NEOB|nr:unnamed protein product [Staurois parvus]
MALGRKGLTSGVNKGLTVCWLTVCCVCFTWETCCCIFLCCAEKYTAACSCWQERDLCCLHTGLSPVSVTR